MANLPSRHRLLLLAVHDLAAQADFLSIVSLKPHTSSSFPKDYCSLMKSPLGEAQSA